MTSSSSGKTIGCIGKCTSGLTHEELDLITDHIQRTLTHTKGVKIFRDYLVKGNRKTDLKCLELYEQCSKYISNERDRLSECQSASVDQLASDFSQALSVAEDLDDVPGIDLSLLERYTEALDSQSRDAMMEILEDTKIRLRDHLRQAHKGFRVYAMQPCPKTR